MGALWDQASIYSLCPRRFQDWIKDASTSTLKSLGIPEGLDVLTQLANIFNNDMMKEFKKLLNNCVTNNLIDKGMNEVISRTANLQSVTYVEKINMQAALQKGDTDAFMKALSPETAKSVFGAAITPAGIIPNFESMTNTANFNYSKLTSFYNSMTAQLLDISNISELDNIWDLVGELQNKQDDLTHYIDLCNDELQQLNLL